MSIQRHLENVMDGIENHIKDQLIIKIEILREKVKKAKEMKKGKNSLKNTDIRKCYGKYDCEQC